MPDPYSFTSLIKRAINPNDSVQDFKDRLVIELADQIDHLQSHSSGDYTDGLVGAYKEVISKLM